MFLDKLTITINLDGSIVTFKKLLTDEDRLKYCLQHQYINAKLDNWLQQNYKFSDGLKDSALALKYKLEGNKAYVQKEELKAISLYNKAIQYAVSETESALLYGNRSAVWYSHCNWKACIRDVDMAFSMNFPEEKIWKLYKRKGESLIRLKEIIQGRELLEQSLKCINSLHDMTTEVVKIKQLLNDISRVESSEVSICKMEKVQDTSFIPVEGWNDKMPQSSSLLMLKYNDNQGRYIIAKKDLASDSVIISEKPYAAVLLPPWFETHCQHCFVKVINMVPCANCTKVCYCSSNCRDQSWSEYHYFECQKLHLMEQIGISHLSLRIILKTDIGELSKFQTHALASELVPNGINGCNQNNVYKGDYNSVYHLLPHSENMRVEDIFQYSLAGVLLYKILVNYNFFPACSENGNKDSKVANHSCTIPRSEGSNCNRNNYRDNSDLNHRYMFIGGLLIRHIQQLVCNAHAITTLNSTSIVQSNILEQDQVRIATAIYPTTSLLNHSCEPSILNCFDKDRLIVKLVKDVKKGEQIYNCYGPHFRRMDFVDRQKALKEQYFFHCQCKHCVKGALSDIEFNTYLCKGCKKGFIFSDKRCRSCNTDLNELSTSYEKKAEKSKQYFSHAVSILQNSQDKISINKALKVLLECFAIQEVIFSENHSEIAKTCDFIGRCYTMLFDYEKCLPYIQRSVKITEVQYGKCSVEATNEMLKLSDIYMEFIQQSIDRKHLKNIQSYLPDAYGVIEKTLHLVEKNKEPNCEDVVILKERLASLLKLRYMC